EIGGSINNAHSAPTDFAVEPVTLAQYCPGRQRTVPRLTPIHDASCLGIVRHRQSIPHRCLLGVHSSLKSEVKIQLKTRRRMSHSATRTPTSSRCCSRSAGS